MGGVLHGTSVDGDDPVSLLDPPVSVRHRTRDHFVHLQIDNSAFEVRSYKRSAKLTERLIILNPINMFSSYRCI